MQGCAEIMKKIFKYIPQRYILGIMGFLAITNAYQMRVCLSVAITEMVIKNDTGSNGTYVDPDACPANLTSSGGSSNAGEFDWDEETQGLILSSFFWGYIVTHIPGGLLADRFGGKYTLGIGIFLTAVFTLLVPVAARAGYGWLLASRVLCGLGEGTTYPAVNDLLARWIPLEERGLIGSLVFAGSQIGTVTGTIFSGLLLSHYKGNWPLVFYFFGILGALWFLFWLILCYSDPVRHPFITDKEKGFLERTIDERNEEGTSPPWRHILTSLPLWGLVAAQVGHDWGFYTMVTDLPKYMSDVLKYNIGQNGVLSSIPYIVMWLVSLATGWLCDFIIRKKWLTVTWARKTFTTVAHIGPSLGIIGASYAGCDRTLVVVLFTVAMGFMGTFYPGMKVNALDLSPNFAGTLMAIVNGIGSIAGIITPYLVGVLTPHHSLMEWRTVFWITVAVNMVTLIIFVTIGSGEVQYWNDLKKVDQKGAENGKAEVTYKKKSEDESSFEGTNPKVSEQDDRF